MSRARRSARVTAEWNISARASVCDEFDDGRGESVEEDVDDRVGDGVRARERRVGERAEAEEEEGTEVTLADERASGGMEFML